MNVNPMQLIQMMRGGMNYQQILTQILPQFQNVPVIQNAVQMAQNGNTAGL